MTTTPFLIEAKLDSPLIITDDAYLTLDSLLSASLQMIGGPKQDLPLDQTAGIYHASAAILVGDSPITGQAPFVSRITNRDCEIPNLHPWTNGKVKKPKKTLHLKSFPNAARIDKYPLYQYPKVIWFGKGDLDQTRHLLSCLPGVGKRCNSGFGQVAEFNATQITTDFSLKLPDSSPARPIPVSLINLFEIDQAECLIDKATFKPNYFDYASADMCVIPTTRSILCKKLSMVRDIAA